MFPASRFPPPHRSLKLTKKSQSIGEPASITATADRAATTVAFRDRFTAEKLFYGPRDIPGVGNVEMAWMPNAAGAGSGSTPTTPTTAGLGPLPKGDRDGDTEMGGGAANGKTGAEGVEDGREMEYDVAEDDGWIA